VDPRHPSPTFADPFRRRAHSLRDHHRPGSVHFTWNARGALFQLFAAMPRRSGTTILVPAYHCLALIKPIVAAGFEIDCYRVRPDFTIDLEDLAARLHAGVVAVLVIHYFGFPADLDDVLPLVRAHGALLIEDCSHSFLTRDRGRWLGQRGDYAVFSYYKCTPSQVGGALVANGGAPLPEVSTAAAPWPVQLAVIRRWLKQADARAPNGPLRIVHRLLGRLVSRGLMRDDAPAGGSESSGAASVLPPPGFLDKPYLFNPLLARVDLPGYVRRIIEASPWDEIALARRRNYAALSQLIPDSTVLRRPLPHLPDGAVPYMFPLLFSDRRPHENALREAGIPYLRFGEVLHAAVESASETARTDAEHLSGSLMLLPVHQGLDERQIRAYVGVLLEYVARLPAGPAAPASRRW
jgi:perosamine synthetase